MNKLGRTLRTWREQITNWHRSQVTNGPTEAANNLAKLIKRVSFGVTNFDHYRIRVLLYAGKPDWTLLDTLTPGPVRRSLVKRRARMVVFGRFRRATFVG
ncbi:transposase [Candidatus Poriferisodalis sp.]|uniref:transposase n=1 Tax=Candidatus Poriferisodalis sp. TaxID=3101277 RepID=UPI003B022521